MQRERNRATFEWFGELWIQKTRALDIFVLTDCTLRCESKLSLAGWWAWADADLARQSPSARKLPFCRSVLVGISARMLHENLFADRKKLRQHGSLGPPGTLNECAARFRIRSKTWATNLARTAVY
jgi:hypothetical protein